MPNKTTFVALLAATTMLASGATFAATQTQPAPTQPAAQGRNQADKDFTKLSADGTRGYQDIVMTRLAIFDGRVDDAKKFVSDADQAFSKAKGDDTVFTKAEADMKTPNADGSAPANKSASADMKAPKAWLPVDGEIGLDEDFSASPTKAAAVANANKSVAKGDRKGAIDALKLADVNLDVVVAVVPLEQTIGDVHQAATLVQNGKFYEASQLLRTVQDSTRYDVADIRGVPKGAAGANKTGDARSTQTPAKAPAATH